MDEPGLPNPVIKESDDQIELRQLAMEADAAPIGEAIPSAQPEPAPRAAEETKESDQPEVKTDNSEASVEPTRDELGRFTKADGSKSEPNERPAESKPDSAFEKAKKERDRQHNLLRNFEAEKAQERARITAERQQIAQERAELESRRNGNNGQFDATQYDRAAEDFEKQAELDKRNNDLDSAADNYALATKARRAAQEVRQAETQRSFTEQRSKFEAAWTGEMQATIQEAPDLGKPETELSKRVAQLLEREQLFNYIPDGFRKAYQIARLQMDAAQASELRENNKQLKAENERLQKLTSPMGGSPTERNGPVSFDQMTTEQRRATLRQMAEQEDGRAA